MTDCELWVTVLKTASLSEALLVQQMLQTYGFHARINAPALYAIFPFSYHETGWYQIQVLGEEQEDVRILLNEFQKGGAPVWSATEESVV